MAAKCTAWLAALLSMVGGASIARADEAPVQFQLRDAAEFQPSAGAKAPISFKLVKPGRVTLAIYSGDNDLVRTLADKQSFAAGHHTLDWDGRDDQGGLVPSEAYHPVIECQGDGQRLTVDSRLTTGGVVIEKIRPQLSADGTIAFDLPQPARVLARVGVKGGAMLRAIDSWAPHAAGRVRLSWDGYDASNVVRLLGEPGLSVLVTAFTLPDHTIIVTGESKQSYAGYRKARKWAAPAADARHGPLERDGQRLSRMASLPRSLLNDPRVSMTVLGNVPRDRNGIWKVSGPVTLKVDMPQEDKWLVQQSLYEVGFFLDHQFVSEEETGYTPLSWRWDPAGVKPGEHTMTVNISGYWGQVGVASIRLLVVEK